jgi:Ca2+-binding RTX toxin-like protein
LARPGVEGLETRNLLSITSLGGIITVTGDNGDDTVLVQIDPNGSGPHDDQVVVTRLYGNGQTESKRENLWKPVEQPGGQPGGQTGIVFPFPWLPFPGPQPKEPSVWLPTVTRIVFDARDGDDVLQNTTALESWAFGGNGADKFHGGSGVDLFHGGDGNDFLAGGGGSDFLLGGEGNDQLSGDAGLDQLFGEAGDDVLDGGQDGLADVLVGGSGADKFKAEWYAQSSGGGLGVKKNRDQPLDFATGDQIISLPLIPFNP